MDNWANEEKNNVTHIFLGRKTAGDCYFNPFVIIYDEWKTGFQSLQNGTIIL